MLLMLHVTGSNDHDVVAPLPVPSKRMPGSWPPRGRVQEHGVLRWFSQHGERVFDVEDVIGRSRELAGFIRAARDHYGLGDRWIIAAGFSSGANLRS